MFFDKTSKIRRKGVSIRAVSAYSLLQCVCTHVREEAINDYRNQYEIGDEEDNPATPFPKDGAYRWEKPKNHNSKIIYYEGIGDEAWMELKKTNYLNRTQSATTDIQNEDKEERLKTG